VGKGYRLLAGGAAAPTGGGGQRLQPWQCHHFPATPAPPSRIALVGHRETRVLNPQWKTVVFL